MMATTDAGRTFSTRGLTTCIYGGFMLLLSLAILVSIRKVGPRKRAARLFFCQMTCCALLIGGANITRGVAMTQDVRSFQLCKGTYGVSLACYALYLQHMLFLHVELYLSVRNMTLARRSALSLRTVILMSVVANVFWAALTVMFIVWLTADGSDFTSFQQCSIFSVYGWAMSLGGSLIFLSLMSTMTVVLSLIILEIRRRSRDAGRASQALLRNHSEHANTMIAMLATFALCSFSTLGANYCRTLIFDDEPDYFYIIRLGIVFSQIFVNEIIYIARNKSLWAYIGRVCRSRGQVDRRRGPAEAIDVSRTTI